MPGVTLPRVYPILDTATLEGRGLALEMVAGAFLEGGAEIIQFRHKGHWSRTVCDQARAIAGLCTQAGAQFIINDRADFALLFGAGLHVGQDDLPAADARRLIGPGALLGLSSHTERQTTGAARQPVDYVAVGPIFGTQSKDDADPVVGVEELRRRRALITKPLVAIGGITLDNALDVWRAGAESAAIIAGLLPRGATAQSIRERMEQWRKLATAV